MIFIVDLNHDLNHLRPIYQNSWFCAVGSDTTSGFVLLGQTQFLLLCCHMRHNSWFCALRSDTIPSVRCRHHDETIILYLIYVLSGCLEQYRTTTIFAMSEWSALRKWQVSYFVCKKSVGVMPLSMPVIKKLLCSRKFVIQFIRFRK